MKVFKKEMKMREVITESHTLCDKCGQKIESEHSFDAFECEFTYKTGDNYPEGGSGSELTLDLCQKCGKEAIEILKSNGFNVQENEWSY